MRSIASLSRQLATRARHNTIATHKPPLSRRLSPGPGRYAIQLMIARQLSDKLKEARLQQRKAEKALEDEKARSASKVSKP